MVWLWSGLFFIKTLLSELVEVDRVLYDFRVTQGYLETWILSIQVLLVPSKYKKWREKEDFCLKRFSNKKWASMGSVEVRISYSQKEVIKRVQNHVNQ